MSRWALPEAMKGVPSSGAGFLPPFQYIVGGGWRDPGAASRFQRVLPRVPIPQHREKVTHLVL